MSVKVKYCPYCGSEDIEQDPKHSIAGALSATFMCCWSCGSVTAIPWAEDIDTMLGEVDEVF